MTKPSVMLFIRNYGLNPEKTISCGFLDQPKCDDSCLKPGKIKVLKMLDLETKSAMKLV